MSVTQFGQTIFGIQYKSYIFCCIHTSTDASGHIISHVPGIIRHFGVFNIIHPPTGDPAGADQTPACVQLAN